MKKDKGFLDIVLRYSLLLLLTIFGIKVFHFLFKPLTKYPVYWFLDVFYETSLNHLIHIPGKASIAIIGACVAGSAYLLFFILNLSTPNINLVKRIKLLSIAIGSFLILNIIRIIILSLLLIEGSSSFSFVHTFFWFFISIVFVAGVWFFEVKKFNIKEIPFYSDIKNILQEIKK